MNTYRFEDIAEGQTESFTRRITGEMMSDFCALTGDENPLHTDAEAARKRGFRDRVSYGMLTASMISTLAGMFLPGSNCLLMEVNSKFARPVYAGDELTVSGSVTKIDPIFRTIDVKTAIINDRGEKVYRGTYRAGFFEEP